MPCHVCAMGAGPASIRLIEQQAGAKVTDMNAGCCGMAGTFGMQRKNYELSERIGKELVAAIGASKARCVLTECSACRMQIEHLTQKEAKHPVKILAEAYGLL